jgi:tetratricopeptide (TPR) repeat protein
MSEATSPKKLAEDGKSAYKRGDYLAAAQMKNNCSVAYLQAGEGEAALNAVEGTAEIFEAAGDLRRQGMAIGNLGAALEAVEHLDEAIEAYQKSAEILAQAGEDQLRANVMHSLSMLQFRQGKQLQALATMQDGLEGVEHPSPKQTVLKKMLRIPFEMFTKNKS